MDDEEAEESQQAETLASVGSAGGGASFGSRPRSQRTDQDSVWCWIGRSHGSFFLRGTMLCSRLWNRLLFFMRLTQMAPTVWHKSLSFFIDKPGEGEAFKAVRQLHCFDAAGMAWYGGRQLEATAQSCWMAPPWAHGAVPERGVDNSLLELLLGQWRLEQAGVSLILSNYDATNAFACSSRADLKTAASNRLLPDDVPFFHDYHDRQTFLCKVRTSPIDRILSRRAARTCKSLSRELGTGGFALNPSKTKSALSFRGTGARAAASRLARDPGVLPGQVERSLRVLGPRFTPGGSFAPDIRRRIIAVRAA